MQQAGVKEDKNIYIIKTKVTKCRGTYPNDRGSRISVGREI